MKDKNHFSTHYKDYGIIYDGKLSSDVQEEVSEKLAVPGEIRVTAIREFRAVSPQSSA